MISRKWLVLWSLWLGNLVPHYTPPVLVSNGWIRGTVSSDGSYTQYTGIPYATVLKRFQAAGPEQKWKGLYDADFENIACAQGKLFNFESSLPTQQDCLILNVYVPNITPNKPLPVMVFIHGGAFSMGSSTRFSLGPEYFMTKDVILVTINYRLDIQGFLCLGIEEAPGNIGLKDQVAALKWVRKNIKTFSGDTDDITLFGESAGAASVSYHLLSPMSSGLFHKAIVQSGSSLAPWATQMNPIKTASQKAKSMGFISENATEMLNFFLSKTDEEIRSAVIPKDPGDTMIGEMKFVPCVEKSLKNVEPFITEDPYDLLSNGKFNQVPVIIGSNYLEGIVFVSMEDDDSLQNLRMEKVFLKDLNMTEEERKNIAKNLLDMYMKGATISHDDTFVKFSQAYYGDPYFTYPGLAETEFIVRKSKELVFHYNFAYDSSADFMKAYLVKSELRNIKGATHASELSYLFKPFYGLIPITDKIMTEKMTTMWTNFAKYGDPTPQITDIIPVRWLPVNQFSPKTFVIDDNMSMRPMWHSETLKYLDKIFKKHKRIIE